MKRRFPRIRTIEPDRAVGFRPTIIDRGAELLGLSRTEFMRRAALHEAQAAILNETVIRVSPEAYDAFMQAISAPAAAPPPIAEVRRVLVPSSFKALLLVALADRFPATRFAAAGPGWGPVPAGLPHLTSIEVAVSACVPVAAGRAPDA